MGRHRDKDGGSKSAQKDSKKGSDSGVISTSGVPLEVGGDTHNEKPKRSQFMQDIIDDWPRNKRKGALFMDSPGVQIFLILLLLLSLFITDAWTLGNPDDSTNRALDAILTAVLVVFALEVTILSMVEVGYYNSFFFYMDVLGTLSILLDIGYIAGTFLPTGTSASGSILRATRTAKLGARYGRLMRILKVLKFVKYCPCVKNDEDEAEPTASSLRKVTTQLSGIISQRVAAMVMIIVIIVPFLSYDTKDHSTAAWLKNLKTLAKNSTSTWEVPEMAARMERFYKSKDVKLVELTIESPYASNVYSNTWDTRDVLRTSNTLVFTKEYKLTPSSSTTYDIEATMDYTVPNQYDAACGIILVMLVICVLMSFSASFQSEVEVLVVAPLEKMMDTLRGSATVMLKSMNVIEKEKGEESKADEEDDLLADEEGDLETLLLEKMVEKLTRIIKLTFPGANVLEVDEGVDLATKSWLNQSYSAGGKSNISEFHSIIDDDDEYDGDSDYDSDNEDPLFEQEMARLDKLLTDKQELIDFDMDNIETWDFDVLKCSHSELFVVFSYLYEKLNVLADFHVPEPIFQAFWQEVENKYVNENPYHNFRHGCDVAHTVYKLITDSRIHMVLSQLEVFALITAALAHDIGHPGLNNGYLIASKHKFALMHNDRSPLENMHCAVVYEIFTTPSTNILLSLDRSQWREARKIILTCILGTDMAHHFEQISKTQLFCEVNKADVHSFCSGETDEIEILKESKDRLFVMELCLHCADVSNPYKSFNICQKWAEVVVQEFCAQGDREKLEGLEVSPMMDRATVNVNNMQLGFIEFVVSPLITAFVNIFYPLNEISHNILVNYCEWAKLRRDEIFSDNNIQEKEEECRKLEERVKKFRDKFAYLEEMRSWPVRSLKKSTKVPRGAQKLDLSTSARQKGSLSPGRRGTAVTLNFSPYPPKAKRRLGMD